MMGRTKDSLGEFLECMNIGGEISEEKRKRFIYPIIAKWLGCLAYMRRRLGTWEIN
jgi:hypothetical protein